MPRICPECRLLPCNCGYMPKVRFGRLFDPESCVDERRPYKPDQIRVDRGEYDRAAGDTVCETCGCVYYDHAPVVGYSWLHRLCNGKFVKL